jgi:hypothetical protein
MAKFCFTVTQGAESEGRFQDVAVFTEAVAKAVVTGE